MKRTLAIARLTFWEGIRMRIVLVLLIVLVFIVLRLPFALRGDETLAGRLQTFLAYSLGALGFFLSLATVFFACATLTREFQTRTLHLVVTKPVSRFQVLLGKWIGVNALNLLIVVLAGLVIYGFARFIKSRPEAFARDRVVIEDVVWTARLAANPTRPDFLAMAERRVKELEESGQEFLRGRQAAILEYAKQFETDWLQIPPGDARQYEFNNLAPPKDRDVVYQVRFKARGVPIPIDEELSIVWGIVDPTTGGVVAWFDTRKRHAEMHQFLIRAANVVVDGTAVLLVANPPVLEKPGYPPIRNDSSILFEGEDSLQILYKVGGFEGNYVRALLLILFRLAFLSALGLFFGTFVSFPVACFCVLSVFVFCLGVPWWLEAIGANIGAPNPTIDPYGRYGPWVRLLLVPVLKVLLPNFVAYDGVGKLIDGYVIDAKLMAWSAAHTLLYGLALLIAPGYLIFRSREVAAPVVH
ncbi:MAG: ABC transporter permease [Planctomycetota bacterium]|nr:MAG: ABC transporter permease [Planctomycetota bacterium]